MAQHDYVIANGTGAAVRSDLNNGLAAIVSQNSGTTEPTTTYAYMRWADTTAGVMKMRNGANNAWITLYQLDGEWSTIAFENGSASAPSIYFKDSGTDTGIYSPGTDQVAISTNGTGRLFVDSSGRVGVGTSSPSVLTHLSTSTDTQLRVESTSASSTNEAAVQLIRGSNQSAIKNKAGGIEFFVQGLTNEIARFDSSGRLGIGTTSPSAPLHVTSSSAGGLVNITSTSTSAALIFNDSGTGGNYPKIGSEGNNLVLRGGALSNAAYIDSSGRLLVGTSTSIGNNDIILAATGNGNNLGAAAFRANASGAEINLYKSRSATIGTNTVVQSGDTIAQFDFKGADGTNYITAASIIAQVDATPGLNDMPGRLVFSTTADGASSPTEAMRINNTGSVMIQTTQLASTSDGCYFNSTTNSEFHQVLCHSSSSSGLANLYINRQGSDGNLIVFRQADTEEGAISVSGTTVTYGGGHLARWSQLPNDEDPSTLLKGTIMSNLDEMCEWGAEDNEQLNKTKVSDVEGDKNVAGVFVSTSFSDDGPLDFFVGMTGDMIIRIAAGVTVERGDLLMSAGDGTAKPQGDGYVQDKTIAKVTSTNVSCTYDDGSYCVPCVLMAC